MSLEKEREILLNSLQKHEYLKSKPVINAMRNVPREMFLPPSHRTRAYLDRPLPIDDGQTISAPHMNAMMCELLQISPGDKILEIGTGSGYHAALLGYITGEQGEVFTIERHPNLADQARSHLLNAEITNVTVIEGDGTNGYSQEAPYDKILITAAGPSIPPPLITQLSPNGGIMCIPLGKKHSFQNLYKIVKSGNHIEKTRISGVMFVPLIGKFGF